MIKQDWMIIVAGSELVDSLEAEQKSRVPMTEGGHYESEALCRLQSEQDRRGIIGITLTESIYGWTVRYDSGLQNFGILAGKRQGNLDGSFTSAVEFAKKWVAEDPSRRYCWMRKEAR
jgi:hypothetical protein